MALVNAPPEFKLDLPPGVTSASSARDVILAFYTARAELAASFRQLAASLRRDGGLWIAWPKKSAGVTTDLNDNVVREVGLAAGLVDNKVCAISHVWSGLHFVYRLKDRIPAATKPLASRSSF